MVTYRSHALFKYLVLPTGYIYSHTTFALFLLFLSFYYNSFKNMHIFIAGGAGFVGSSLALYFRNHYPSIQVTVMDNLMRKGSELNVPTLQSAGVRFLEGDTRFPSQLAIEGPVDVIIDAAAEPSVLSGFAGGLDYLVHTNFNGTVHLLDLAKEKGAGFIFLSTSRVYPYTPLLALPMRLEGERLCPDEEMPGLSARGITENFPLSGVRSFYGATKLSSELMVQEYSAAFGMPVVINRCGVIAGPRQMGKVDQGVTMLWLAKHYWKKSLQYIGFGGQGHQVRDLLHVEDLCRLVAYEVQHLGQLSGHTFNVGGGAQNAISLAELTSLCRDITGNTISITSAAQNRPADIPWYITDNSLITKTTDWRPEKSVRNILEDSYNWLREHEVSLEGMLG